MKNNQKRNHGLIAMYLLLLTFSSLVQQITYYGVVAVILAVITVLLLRSLWNYLLRNKIITITWATMTYGNHVSKSEQLFLCSLVTVIAPVLRFHDITAYDIGVTILTIVVALVGFLLNERYLRKKQ